MGNTLCSKTLHNYNIHPPGGVSEESNKLFTLSNLSLSGKTQEKKDLFFSNKITNFASVEVLLY